MIDPQGSLSRPVSSGNSINPYTLSSLSEKTLPSLLIALVYLPIRNIIGK